MNLKQIVKHYQMKSFSISESIAICDGTLFHLSRLVGLAPLQATVTSQKITLKWSLLYNLYSYIIVTIGVGLGLYGVLNDLWAGEHSIRMSDPTGRVVTFADISTVFLLSSIGIFGAPFRIPYIAKFYGILVEVDDVLPPTEVKKARNRNIIYILVVFLYMTIVLTVDLYTWIRFASLQSEGEFVVKNFLPFYCCYYVVLLLELQYGQGAVNIERRFKKLNEYLEISEIEKIKSRNEIKKNWNSLNKGNVSGDSLKSKHLGSIIDLLSRHHKITDDLLKFNDLMLVNSPTDYIIQLQKVHSKLCEAVVALNNGFGFVALVVLISCLLHLIETPYFLLLELTGRHDNLFLTVQFLWIGIHLLRLLIIIHPCFLASNAAKQTKIKVCEILCSSRLDESLRKQLEIFSLQLIQRQVEFTACGLCVLDRPLLSAIAGAVTTYLVILFQLKKGDI